MAIEIKVPVLPESVSDATIATWHKKPGDAVKRDENLVDVETDKVVLEVSAPEDGVMGEILAPAGTKVLAKQVIGHLTAGKASESTPTVAKSKPMEPKPAEVKPELKTEAKLTPAVRQVVFENNVDPGKIPATGRNGRLTTEDVEKFIAPKESKVQSKSTASQINADSNGRPEDRVPMTRLRLRIAERLVASQQNTATLTTFNEVDLHRVIKLRNEYKDEFEKKYGVRLGFMSFFVNAAIEALKRFPAVNASIDGSDIIYHGYYDIGIAVSSPRGLIVPIIRNAENLNVMEIEKKIKDFGDRAQAGKLDLEELTGGTFTISNGGVFGSLMSTPILNPPQSAILGMHKIMDRPVAENGKVIIRPMMYLALSYDHRIIDGAESVQFLRTIKELLESPARALLGV